MQRRSRKKKLTILFLSILLFVIAIRVALPYIVLHYANKSLAEMNGYYGHIKDVDLAIIRGAYKIDSVYLNKSDSATGKQTPFFAASVIDLSIEWKSLFKGSIVGKVAFEEPLIVFTKDKVEPDDVVRDSSDFRKVLNDFMPLDVNRCEIRNGRLQFIDRTTRPTVDIQMTQLNVLAQNLRNSYDSTSLLPASVRLSSDVYEGKLNMTARLNPLADDPTFDMTAELVNTNLVKLNDFFQAYAKIDVNKGRFGIYAEAAGKDGRFNGYVKPVIKDLDILGKEDRKDNLLQKLWEAVAGGVGQLFRNHPNDQVATKIPFKGSLDNPRTNIWYALTRILQNAFIHAIQPSIDNEINIGTVDKPGEEKKTLLEKVFGNKDKKEGRKERREERKEKRQERREERE